MTIKLTNIIPPIFLELTTFGYSIFLLYYIINSLFVNILLIISASTLVRFVLIFFWGDIFYEVLSIFPSYLNFIRSNLNVSFFLMLSTIKR